MARSRSRGKVAGIDLMDRTFGRPALEDETTIAIAAVDVTLLVDFQPDTRMAERRRAVVRPATNIAGPVAPDARAVDEGCFRYIVHESGD